MKDEPTDDEIRAMIKTFPGDVFEFNVQRDEQHGSHLAFRHHRGEAARRHVAVAAELLYVVRGGLQERGAIRRRILDALVEQAAKDAAAAN